MEEHIEETNTAEVTRNKGWHNLTTNQRLIVVMMGLLVVVIVGLVVTQLQIASLKSPAVVEQTLPEEVGDEEAAVLEGLSRHMILPQNEVPSIAAIVDADALIAEQSFYAGSQNGDQLILYPESQRAIIYSPSRDIIVNAGSLVVTQDEGLSEQQ